MYRGVGKDARVWARDRPDILTMPLIVEVYGVKDSEGR